MGDLSSIYSGGNWPDKYAIENYNTVKYKLIFAYDV